jgi:uncharacterized membrane protein
VTLPLFTSRRRHPVRCTNCGTKLERVLPGVPYYTLAFITGMLLEIAVLVSLFLIVVGQWKWIVVIVAGLTALNLGVSVFLNNRTRVEYANIEDARRDKPGRWYPE